MYTTLSLVSSITEVDEIVETIWLIYPTTIQEACKNGVTEVQYVRVKMTASLQSAQTMVCWDS